MNPAQLQKFAEILAQNPEVVTQLATIVQHDTSQQPANQLTQPQPQPVVEPTPVHQARVSPPAAAQPPFRLVDMPEELAEALRWCIQVQSHQLLTPENIFLQQVLITLHQLRREVAQLQTRMTPPENKNTELQFRGEDDGKKDKKKNES
jgi:hypothetical protein